MMKKISNVFKVLLMILVITTFNIKATEDDGNWTKMGGNNTNSKVLTNPKIIKSNEEMKKRKTIKGSFRDAIIIDNLIYVVNGKPGKETQAKATLEAYDLDGKMKKKISLKKGIGNFSRLAYDGDETVFVSLSNCIEAINIETKESLWISDVTVTSQQMLSQMVYHDGYLYGGVATKAPANKTSDGFYYAINTEVTPKNEIMEYAWTWKKEDKDGNGFYWDGAAIVEKEGKKAIVFVGDSGKVVSHDLKRNQVYDTYDLTTTVDGLHKVRSLVYYNKDKQELLIGTQDSQHIFKIPLKIEDEKIKFDEGKIKHEEAADQISGGINLSNKVKGNLYVSSGGMRANAFSIYGYNANASKLEKPYITKTYGTQSFPLINIDTETNTEYTYFIDYKSGDMIISKLKGNASKPDFERISLPEIGNSPDYNSASVIASKKGDLVITKNDGGPLFIIRNKDYEPNDAEKLSLDIKNFFLENKEITIDVYKNDYLNLKKAYNALSNDCQNGDLDKGCKKQVVGYTELQKAISVLNNKTSKVKKKNTTYYYKFKTANGKWFNYKTIKKSSTKITTSLYNYSSSRMKGSTDKKVPLSGALKKKISTITMKSGRVTGKKFNYYNSKGKLTKLLKYKANKKYKFVLVNKQTKSYYKNGKIKTHFSYNKSLKTKKNTSKTQIYYNSKGKKTKRIKYTYKNGKIVKKTVRKY